MPDAPPSPAAPLAHVRHVPLPGAGTLALVTLDDGAPPGRPVTLEPEGLASLRAVLAEVGERAARGEVVALALTGKPGHFAAGADLRLVRTVTDDATARAVAAAGHRTVEALADLPVPTFALLGGPALGGGLELALACDARVVAEGVTALGLPEVSLGLVPGWGGCFALPRLIGPDAALAVIVDNPLHGNRLLTAADALALGLVDAVLPEPFLDGALAWVAASLAREGRPTRARRAEPEDFHRAAAEARRRTEERVDGAVPAADAAIDLVEAAATRTRQEAHAAEDEALARLLLSDEMRAALYAWELTTRRARRPPGAPDAALARPVRAVGLLGAGLMARQLGLLLARRLRVPVTLREIDAERAEAGRAAILDEVARLHGRGRLDEDEARRLAATVRTTVHLADLRGSDLVIEAVVEDLAVKCRVVAEVEEVLEVGAVIATNTSALSVGAMARAARHPGRVVGLHFFNPVAQMPLVEVVRAAQTDDAALATAFAVVAACGKTAVAVRDAPGFVVNRVLVRLLGEVLGALEEGTSVAVADRALRPMGLPMGPFQLLQLVGPAVAHHVLAELRTGLGDRFPASPGLARLVAEGRPLVVAAQGRPTATSPVDPGIAAYFPGAGPGLDEPALLRRVQDALAEEVSLLLRDGVVPEVEDVDLGMILGAAWPPHLGGISPYLDRTGASERVTGVRFHPPGVASRVGATGSVAGHPPAGAQ